MITAIKLDKGVGFIDPVTVLQVEGNRKFTEADMEAVKSIAESSGCDRDYISTYPREVWEKAGFRVVEDEILTVSDTRNLHEPSNGYYYLNCGLCEHYSEGYCYRYDGHEDPDNVENDCFFNSSFDVVFVEYRGETVLTLCKEKEKPSRTALELLNDFGLSEIYEASDFDPESLNLEVSD